MAINTQKFLPLAKSSSAIVKSAGSNISTESSKGGAIIKQKKLNIKKFIPPEKQEEDNKEKKYGTIIKNLVSIDKFLKSGLVGDKKTFESEKQEKKEEKSKEREKKLETKEKPKGLSGGISLPKFDFLESVKRYFLFTFLGWLFTNTQQYLPQLMKIVDIIKPVISVAEFIFKGLLEGFVAFVDLGYQTYDGLRKKVEDIGGKGAAKTFDEFSGHLNKLINGAIMASMLIISTAPKKPNAPSGAGAGAGVPRPTAPKPISGFGGGTEMTPGRYRAPGQSASRGFALESARKGLSFEQSVAARQAAKVAPVAKGARFGAGRIPIIGPLITFGIRTLVYGEKPQKAAAAAIGMGLGQAVGTFIGSLGAGALGLGTAGLGAVVAPLIIGAGSIIGGLVGEWIGSKLYDFIVGFGKDNKPQRKAAGGPVTKGGKVSSKRTSQGRSRRTIKVAPRKPVKLPPQRTQPGKDIGGEKQIKKLYPDPDKKMSLDEFLRSSIGQGSYTYVQYEKDIKDKKPNPYKALTSTAKILKEIPFVGGLMGAAVDIALGQKPDKNVYKSLSSGIGYLVESLANQKANISMSSLIRDIRGFADGGYISPSRELKGIDDTSKTGDMVAKLLGPTIDQRVNEAIQSIDKELQNSKKKKEGEDTNGGGDGPGGGGGPDGGGGGGMLPGDAPPEVKAALEAIAGAEGGWNSVNPEKVVPGLTNMTIAQAREVGMRQRKIEGSGALGKFQQIPVYEGVNTLKQRAEAAGLDYQKDKFNEENQTKIARAYIAGIYPGGEAQLVKDAKKDPMILADKLKGVYPSLPGGGQPNVHTSGYLDRYKQSLEKHRTVKLGAITPDKIYSLDPSQGRDPGQPGIDFTYKGGKTLALYPGKVIDIASQYNPNGSGYGNYVLVESIDPNNGKKFTALYAHFGDGKIYVRKGDTIQSGQVIGAQPNRNIRGHFTGSGSGEHTSVDFYQPDGRTEYSGSNKLITQILDSFAGKNPYPTQTQPPKQQAAKPGQPPRPGKLSQQQLQNIQLALSKKGSIPITVGDQKYFFRANPDGTYQVFKPRNLLGYQEEVNVTGDKNKEIQDAIRTKIRTMYAVPSASSPRQPVQRPTGNTRGIPDAYVGGNNMQGGGPIGPSKPSIPNVGKSAYYEEQGSTIVFVPIENQIMVPVPMKSSSGPLMFPSSSLNTKDTYPSHSLSRG